MGRKQKYQVKLSKDERNYLTSHLEAGTYSTRFLNRVRILLLSDRGEYGKHGWIDKKVGDAVGVTKQTVGNIRKKYVKNGIEKAIKRKEYDNSNRERKLDGHGEAQLIALLMSDPPEGHSD